MTRTVRRTPKIDRDATIDVNALTADERTMLAAFLARFTTGGGPYPNENNLKFWRAHYALACIKKAFRAGIHPKYKSDARTLEKKVLAMATRARA